jgi:hypothetical protein
MGRWEHWAALGKHSLSSVKVKCEQDATWHPPELYRVNGAAERACPNYFRAGSPPPLCLESTLCHHCLSVLSSSTIQPQFRHPSHRSLPRCKGIRCHGVMRTACPAVQSAISLKLHCDPKISHMHAARDTATRCYGSTKNQYRG